MTLLGPNGQQMTGPDREEMVRQARQAVDSAVGTDDESPPDTAPTHMTGFWVVVDFDGTALASNQLDADYRFARPAGVGDMFSACSQVVKDITSMEVSQRTVMLMAQQAQMAQQQIDAARAAQAVLADPTGARIRGGK